MGPGAFWAVLAVFGAIVIAAILAYIAFYISRWRRLSFRSRIMMGIPLLLIVGGVAYLNLPYTRSDAVRAKEIMNLPSDARILSVGDGDYRGGYVEFTLPPSQSPEKWIDNVWDINPLQEYKQYEINAKITKKRYEKSADKTLYFRSLKYDPARQTYEYNIFYGDD